MITEKIIFLDIDGVMDTGNYCGVLHSKGLPTSDEYGTVFDPRSVANLRHVIEETRGRHRCEFFWKEFMSFMDLDNMWNARHLPGQITGTTPVVTSLSRED